MLNIMFKPFVAGLFFAFQIGMFLLGVAMAIIAPVAAVAALVDLFTR